jgi:hypothetical protein
LLQQLPPHVGSVPPVVAAPQIVPAVVHPPEPAASSALHVPSVAPAALVQLPPQQSTSVPHASPFWTQNDAAAAQTPFWQSCEQQSPLAVHGLPEVLHVVLSGVHLPAVHLPPQHAPSAVHAPLSAVHCVPEHVPLTQEKVQHWLFVVHAAPAPAHAIAGASQTLLVVLQLFDAQSPLLAHVEPPGSSGPVGPPEVPPEVPPDDPSAPPSEFASTPDVSLPHPPSAWLLATRVSASAPPTNQCHEEDCMPRNKPLPGKTEKNCVRTGPWSVSVPPFG